MNDFDEIDGAADLFTLVDDDGNEQNFEVIDTMEQDDEIYYALMPVFDKEEDYLDDDGDFVVLKLVEDAEEELLATIDDEEEYDRIGAIFLERLQNMYDDEDDDDDDQDQD